jgi:hypothetical protein
MSDIDNVLCQYDDQLETSFCFSTAVSCPSLYEKLPTLKFVTSKETFDVEPANYLVTNPNPDGVSKCIAMISQNPNKDFKGNDYIILGAPFFHGYYVSMNYELITVTIGSTKGVSTPWNVWLLLGIIVLVISLLIGLCCLANYCV